MSEAICESLGDLRRWMPWAQTAPSASDSEAFVRDSRARFDVGMEYVYLVFRRSDGVLLGAVGLHRIDWGVRSLEIGYWCRTSAQRHGYVTEAVNELLRVCFQEMNARRVEIRCDSGNERSARVAERCGLQLDGRLRNAALSPDGQVVDKLVFSMIPLEYEVRHR